MTEKPAKQEKIKLTFLDNIFEKAQRPDVVVKPKRHRQGNRSLHGRIHPSLLCIALID